MEVNKEDYGDYAKLEKIWSERNTHEYSWVKQVLSVMSILLGLVITLKSGDSKNQTEHVLFIITVVSNALCILCGLIFLHREADTLHNLGIEYAKYIHLPSQNKRTELITSSPKKIYATVKVLFFSLIFSSVISLVAYAIFTDNVKTKTEFVEKCK